MRRFLICAVSVTLILFAGTELHAEHHESSRPNIIWVMADDLGYGDLGCYGQELIQTPHIDALAANGMRFTDFYAGSTVCAPSRCTLMTGLHTGHCYVRGNWRLPLRPQDITVAEVLKQAGYNTALVGKWGLGEPGTTGVPNKQGFDFFFGYLNQRHAHNYWPEYLYKNEARFPLKGNVVPNADVHGAGVASERKQYSHDVVMREALEWLDNVASAGEVEDEADPFFLYLALTIPHANNEARNKGMEVPSLAPYSNRDWPAPQKGHAAMITRMDRDMGRLMKKLQELNVAENTVVFFTSDNGPHKEGGADPQFFDSNGPLSGYKRSMHDGGIRVPMIAHWPGHIEAGSESDHVGAFWDFLPTAADLAGVNLESVTGLPKLDGISFVPTLLGRDQPVHDWLYWEFHERGMHQAARHGPWKAVRAKSSDAPIELYSLERDLGEQQDVSADFPDVVREFEEFFSSARTPHIVPER